MTILHIETSTNVCSVALSNDGVCLFEISNNEGLNHAAMLSPFVQQAIGKMNELHLKPEAIAVSAGPGSYTGLRIGVSTAKGLCYGYKIPLIAVGTLEILAVDALKTGILNDHALLCPMIDARRMEVYSALYTEKLELKREVSAEIINENSFQEILDQQPVYFFGNGASKCKPLITHPNARFIDSIEPLAKNMILTAEKKYAAHDYADVAYFEPFYLKEFQATIPKQLF
ncbi:MAG TPA: tRNA (adenosine(37)-N6)-threonylcarbamoyltransferase complex dimerization subunit type 1 TsaB [Paludibacteraceae bacterium]|nr:tRNA (adenosine(37)-N6)-threonylcarbamoyltransferase complex dimerization subunit type 1 TsaB [Paludibacteraceae bacterium]